MHLKIRIIKSILITKKVRNDVVTEVLCGFMKYKK